MRKGELMNTRSARSGKVMKRVLLIAVLMGIVYFAFPSKAFAGTQYGTTSTKSGFGYTLKSNTLINNWKLCKWWYEGCGEPFYNMGRSVNFLLSLRDDL